MSRRNADPTALIARLEAALKVARPRDIADANLMAEIVGMTWRNLQETYIKPDPAFPIKVRGSEGRGYQFEVTKVLRHMIGRARQRQAENSKRSANAARLTGFTVPEDGIGMDLAEISKLADLTVKAQAMKNEQGYYVPAASLSTFLSGYNAVIRDELLGTSAVIDPTGDLSPEHRRRFDERMRTIAVEIQRKAERYIEEHCAGIQQAGTGRRAGNGSGGRVLRQHR